MTEEADVLAVIQDLSFPHRGAKPYLNEVDEKLVAELIAMNEATGQSLSTAALRAELLDVIPAPGDAESTESKPVTCNPKFMKKLVKKMKTKKLISVFKPAAVSLNRAKQRDPALEAEMSNDLLQLWEEHQEKGLLEGDVPLPEQLFNMDEIA